MWQCGQRSQRDPSSRLPPASTRSALLTSAVLVAKYFLDMRAPAKGARPAMTAKGLLAAWGEVGRTVKVEGIAERPSPAATSPSTLSGMAGGALSTARWVSASGRSRLGRSSMLMLREPTMGRLPVNVSETVSSRLSPVGSLRRSASCPSSHATCKRQQGLCMWLEMGCRSGCNSLDADVEVSSVCV